jgi:hypothetical protein
LPALEPWGSWLEWPSIDFSGISLEWQAQLLVEEQLSMQILELKRSKASLALRWFEPWGTCEE